VPKSFSLPSDATPSSMVVVVAVVRASEYITEDSRCPVVATAAAVALSGVVSKMACDGGGGGLGLD
jgi:hypothetical protein